jgi:FixJ family two-component response regulator
MCRLSKQEEQVLDLAMTSADNKIVALNLHISENQVRVVKARVKKKRAKAQALLDKTRKYKSLLYPDRIGE